MVAPILIPGGGGQASGNIGLGQRRGAVPRAEMTAGIPFEARQGDDQIGGIRLQSGDRNGASLKAKTRIVSQQGPKGMGTFNRDDLSGGSVDNPVWCDVGHLVPAEVCEPSVYHVYGRGEYGILHLYVTNERRPRRGSRNLLLGFFVPFIMVTTFAVVNRLNAMDARLQASQTQQRVIAPITSVELTGV